MTTPSTIFVSLPELLGCLAEQIRNPKELLSLCLVNTTFNAVVTPFLCRKLILRTKRVPGGRGQAGGRGKAGGWLSRLQPTIGNDKNYIHVRELVVHAWFPTIHPQSHVLLLQMLPKLPRLESFRWLVPYNRRLPADVLSALHASCQAIKAIHIHLPDVMGVREQVGYGEFIQPLRLRCGATSNHIAKPDLTVFPRLVELTLQNLPRELPRWRSHIVQVLGNSPGLRSLTLSVDADTVVDYAEAGERDKFEGFFDRLCDEYGETGAAPLRLRTLRLGTAVYPFKLDSLTKLTDLRFLEEVHVENLGVYDEVSDATTALNLYNGDGVSGLAWDAFGSARCPNLRRFCIAEYQRDVHDFLATRVDPSSARKLAVSCGGMWSDRGIAALLRPDPAYPSLPLHLRMISINLLPTQVPHIPSAEAVLDDLVSGDDGALEGLAVHLSENPEARGGFDNIDLLVHALGKLVNLAQLAISLRMERREGQSPPEFRDAMINATRKIADVLAAAPPRLRYIKVDGEHWQVCRNGDGTIRLEELNRYGISEVELFEDLMYKPVSLQG